MTIKAWIDLDAEFDGDTFHDVSTIRFQCDEASIEALELAGFDIDRDASDDPGEYVATHFSGGDSPFEHWTTAAARELQNMGAAGPRWDGVDLDHFHKEQRGE